MRPELGQVGLRGRCGGGELERLLEEAVSSVLVARHEGADQRGPGLRADPALDGPSDGDRLAGQLLGEPSEPGSPGGDRERGEDEGLVRREPEGPDLLAGRSRLGADTRAIALVRGEMRRGSPVAVAVAGGLDARGLRRDQLRLQLAPSGPDRRAPRSAST